MPVVLQVTLREAATGLLLASTSCAVTVMAAPATGFIVAGTTMYFVGAPATLGMEAWPVTEPVVARRVVLPAVVFVVKLTDVKPFASVVLGFGVNVPPRPAVLHVTLCEVCTGLLY